VVTVVTVLVRQLQVPLSHALVVVAVLLTLLWVQGALEEEELVHLLGRAPLLGA